MRVGGDASAMAKAMARDDDGARSHARVLRFQVMLALRETVAAHGKLAEAVRAVVEDGTDLVLDDSPYPDDAQAYDLMQGPAMAYDQLAGWVASLEGRVSLAELMLQGPPGFEPVELRAGDGTVFWTTADPGEVRDSDGNVFDRAFVEWEMRGQLRPTQAVSGA